jgi:hypothetical protein
VAAHPAPASSTATHHHCPPPLPSTTTALHHCPPPPLPSTTPPCRYIISTDGWTASSKLEKYLLMGSTVLKQASPLIAYYYAAMSPWVHYVPFFEYSEGETRGQQGILTCQQRSAPLSSIKGREQVQGSTNRDSGLIYQRGTL